MLLHGLCFSFCFQVPALSSFSDFPSRWPVITGTPRQNEPLPPPAFVGQCFIESKLGQRVSRVVNVNTRMEWDKHGGQRGHSDIREVGEESMNNELVSGAEEDMKQKELSIHSILPETEDITLSQHHLESGPGTRIRSWV